MRIGPTGALVDEPRLRAGLIGCGSHAFRNILPTFQFTPVELVATCDRDLAKAQAFAAQFGALRAHADHTAMLAAEQLDAVFVVVGLDESGRPRYPEIVLDCLDAGCHVWTEKPPAAAVVDIEQMQRRAREVDRQVMVGFKKMFAPANEHARRLTRRDDFGAISQAMTQYPVRIPTVDEYRRYLVEHQRVDPVADFLDHLCHPASTLLHLLGPPQRLWYERTRNGGGTAVLAYADGATATLSMTWGAAAQDGLERTTVIADDGAHVVVDNNIRVSLHRMPVLGYGDVADFYATEPDRSTVVWEPEFSLGQLYNKGLFLLGYYAEINEFARAVLDRRAVTVANLVDAWHLTRLFEAFADGPGRQIELGGPPAVIADEPADRRDQNLRAGSATTSARAAPDVRHVADEQWVRFAWGGRANWLVSGAAPFRAAMTIGVVEIDAGCKNPLHLHPNSDEALHLLEGELRHRIGDDVVDLVAGDTIHVPADTPHDATNTGSRTARMLVAYPTGDRQMVILE